MNSGIPPGIVATPHLSERLGQVAEEGELIALIQDTSSLRLEIAADEAAAALVEPGMRINAHLQGIDGRLIRGRVISVSAAAITEQQFQVEAFRSDREALIDRGSSPLDPTYRFLVTAALDPVEVNLLPGMTGPVRIVTGTETFGRALVRPILRYFRTEVWSWLP